MLIGNFNRENNEKIMLGNASDPNEYAIIYPASIIPLTWDIAEQNNKEEKIEIFKAQGIIKAQEKKPFKIVDEQGKITPAGKGIGAGLLLLLL